MEEWSRATARHPHSSVHCGANQFDSMDEEDAMFQPCLESIVDTEITGRGFDGYAEELESNALFHISQKSHELFHSGMIAWLIRRCPAFGEVLFPSSYMANVDVRNIAVETEKNHRDITIIVDDSSYYIVENKFKSFYTTKQLQQYADDLKNELEGGEGGIEPSGYFKGGVVLGVLDNADTNLPRSDKWEYKGYAELLREFLKVYEEHKSEFEVFEQGIIEHYLSFLDAILSLLSPYRSDLANASWRYVKKFTERIDRVGLEEFAKRMAANAFEEYFRDNHLSKISTNYGRIEIDSPFAYGKEQTVEFKIVSLSCTANKVEPLVVVKITLCGEEIRRAVQLAIPRRQALSQIEGWNANVMPKRYAHNYTLTPTRIEHFRFECLAAQVKKELLEAVKQFELILPMVCQNPQKTYSVQHRR